MTIYRLLLLLYPAGFRSEYGDEMCAVFREKQRRARGFIGGIALWVEVVFDVVRHALPLHVDALRLDIRYTGRSLLRSPMFALTVVTVSALGIGANTAVFTVVDRVLVRPLPYDDPGSLVRVWESPPGYSRMEASPPNYRDWSTMATSFVDMSPYYRLSANLVGAGDPERVQGTAVGGSMLQLLGVQPLFGRLLTAQDEVTDLAVILSYNLWQRNFGGDQDILGRSVVLDDQQYSVIGVMPPAFAFPDQRAQFWTALRLGPDDYEDRNNNYLEVIARLKPDVSLETARLEMREIMRQLEVAYPIANENNSASVNELGSEVPRQTRLLLTALMGASLAVLLIACTNLANLLLARAMVRRQEFAVRSSLGAGRQRLVRQLITESITLAGIGGLVGVGLAYLSLPLLEQLVPLSVPVTSTSIDLRILGFALGVTALTGIGFGALPAMRAGKLAIVSGLNQSARGGGLRSGKIRGTLVVVEVAACIVLLIASGLLIRTLAQVRSTSPGFAVDGVLTARTWLPWPRYESTAARADFYSQVLDEVRAVPGVENAAFTSFLPMVMGGGIWPVEMDGQVLNRSRSQSASLRFVTPGYFETLSIPQLRGRDFQETDTQDANFVAVVSQSFVDRYWPGEDPIGRTFRFAFSDRTIVGVVGDIRVRGLERQSEPQVYLPHRQVNDGGVPFYAPKDIAIQFAGDALTVVPMLRDIVRRVDPLQPLSNVQLLEEIVAEDTAPRDLQVRVLVVFAALAFILAAIGIHGVLSFTVTHRAREIGVRMALGAQRRAVVAMFLREGVVLGLLGITVGAAAGLSAANAMEALLFGVQPMDPATFGAAVGLALVMTLAGSVLPALRAATVDPNSVMREG